MIPDHKNHREQQERLPGIVLRLGTQKTVGRVLGTEFDVQGLGYKVSGVGLEPREELPNKKSELLPETFKTSIPKPKGSLSPRNSRRINLF